MARNRTPMMCFSSPIAGPFLSDKEGPPYYDAVGQIALSGAIQIMKSSLLNSCFSQNSL